MRITLLRTLAALGCLFILSGRISAQYSFNCARDTMVAGCPAAACITLKTLIPDPQRSATTYAVNSPTISPTCLLAANDPALPGTATGLNLDDTYSPTIPIGFPFVFFGTTFTDLKVSSNGYVTFNTALTGFSHYGILRSAAGTLTATPGAGVIPEDLPSTLYANSIIMGPYHDIDVGVTATPPGRIEYIGSGTSPYRTWTINFYRIPLFLGTCNSLRENTHQIVLYESTGIIEVNIFDKQICTGWNDGRAMVGVQNAARDVGVMAPGRKASDNPWGVIGMNEKWKFVPVGGTPLFRRVELYDLANTLVATGTTIALPNGDRDVSFANICAPAGASTTFIVKAFYDKIDDPTTEVYGVDTIRINRTQGLAANAAFTQASCGLNNGTITVTPNGGVGPYQYSLDGVTWQSSNVFTGLLGGTYTVYVKDSGPVCTANIPVTVTVSGNLATTRTKTNAACTGVSNGTITITSAGGTGPYTFSIDGGPAVPGTLPFTFSGLAGGSHTIVVTQTSDGCSSGPIIENITTGTGVTATTAATATSCPGATNGTITVNTTAGTAPFTFQLGANPPQASNVFTGLAGGTYTITVRDAVGCTRVLTRTVLNGTAVTATTALTAASCSGASNGSVIVTPTNGTGPYTFVLDGVTTQTGATNTTFTNLAPGPHSVVITDNPTGCLSNTINFTIAAGAVILANAVPAATSCNGAADGSITVTPTTGTAPYTYSLDGGAYLAGAAPYTFSNLAAGAHTIRVTDANGCVTNVINVNIAVGPQLAATAAPSATSCNGASNGSITVTPTNGNAPYTFSLDGAAAVSGAAPYTFTNVPAGPHTVVMTDAAGCITNTINVDVAVGPTLTTTVNKTDVACNGNTTGSIVVTQPVIGIAPYEYSLDNITWQASNTFSGLAAGTYTVYYREGNGCVGSQTITVTEPTAMTASAATVPVVCNGQSNGIITVTSGGGVAPHEFSIDGGTTWQSSNIFNVPAGPYTITIRDANGCTTTRTVTITEPAVLSAAPVNTNASCDGGNDGTITVNATGGNASYEYSIDNGATWQAGNVFNVAPGNYTVSVRDNLGCTATFNTTVGLTNNLSFTAQTDPTICESKSTQLDLVSNATQYVWTPATGLSNTTIHNPVANPVVTTEYIVTATLGRCSVNDTVIVNVNAAPVPNAGTDGFICYGQTYQLNAGGGTVYKWTPSTYLDDPNISNPISTPAKDITYTVTILSDANGCASLVTDEMRIDVTPPVKVKTFPYDTIGYPGDRFMLMAVPSDPDANIYTWTPSAGLSNPNIANPIVTIGPIGSDLTYQVITSTIAGCKGEGYVHIKVYTGPDIYVPTGFTPNGDGRNDRFTPFPVGIKGLNYFRVFNRWGQMVFSTSTLHQGWDGKLGGTDQPSGTYVWMAEGISNNGKVITKKGVVTLIR